MKYFNMIYNETRIATADIKDKTQLDKTIMGVLFIASNGLTPPLLCKQCVCTHNGTC